MKLLLDEHVAAAVAEQLRAGGVDALTIAEWCGGIHRGADDELILGRCALEGRVLVTYDRKTVPPLLVRWAQEGLHHAGVLLVDERTIRPQDRGGLLRAIRRLADQRGADDWTDRVVFLRRP